MNETEKNYFNCFKEETKKKKNLNIVRVCEEFNTDDFLRSL